LISKQFRRIVKWDKTHTLLRQFFVGSAQPGVTEDDLYRLVQLIQQALPFAENARSVDDFDEFQEDELLTFVETLMERLVRLICLVFRLGSQPTPPVALILGLESIGARLSQLSVQYDISLEEFLQLLWLDATCRAELINDVILFVGKDFKAPDVPRPRISTPEPTVEQPAATIPQLFPPSQVMNGFLAGTFGPGPTSTNMYTIEDFAMEEADRYDESSNADTVTDSGYDADGELEILIGL
ncbi:hypothetical protein HDU76_011556, partial [Blyttiomyces sp. JEL0837]